jgi:hypothetical protein
MIAVEVGPRSSSGLSFDVNQRLRNSSEDI